ncbi:MAG TPA: D-alanyl-D-alanine carboxypeptidase/D-alanyl-D-alanine-endopeptidase [Polyangiaceae bacterium]
MRLRGFDPSFPLIALGCALIVGGAPEEGTANAQSAATPAANAQQSLPVATATATASQAISAALPASKGSSPPIPIGGPPQRSDASRVSLAAPPSAPPHAWKGDEFERPLRELSSWVTKNGGHLTAAVSDVESGRELGAVAADAVENPASNQKILTTAAVLAHLGADYRFHTALSGKREGDAVSVLVLQGNGDPSLTQGDLTSLAKTLAQSGVARVEKLAIDQSYFDGSFTPPAFEQQPNEWAAFRAPVSAVALDRNTTTLHVAPGSLGQPARAWFEPPGFVELSGSVRTEKSARSENVKLTLKPNGQRLSALVAGAISPAAQEFRWARRVEDPTLLAAYGLRQALETAGIRLEGGLALGSAQGLPELGKDSDNFYAETLLKDLGAQVKGAPGTSANGADVVLDYLRQIDALGTDTRVSNGSGLFDANRVSAHTLVKVLVSAYKSPATGGAFLEQLAVGGVDGTLHKRFLAFKKQRSIRAKTGTLNDVIALSGFALRPDGSSPVAFSIIVSGVAGKHGEVRQKIDAIVSKIAKELAAG